MMFWKIKTKEYKELSEKYLDLSRKITLLEIDLSLLTDKLAKAISRKVIKKTEETEEEKNKNPQIIPI